MKQSERNALSSGGEAIVHKAHRTLGGLLALGPRGDSWLSDLERLSTDEIVREHERVFNPARASLIAVGDFDSQELIAELEARFGGFRGHELPEATAPSAQSAVSPARLVIIDRPALGEVAIAFGARSEVANVGPRERRDLLAHVLFGNGKSGLRRALFGDRDPSSLSVNLFSSLGTTVMSGSLVVPTSALVATLKSLASELARLRRGGVSTDVLEWARQSEHARIAVRYQSVTAALAAVGELVMTGAPIASDAGEEERTRAVTKSDLDLPLRALLYLDSLRYVFVGDGGLVRDALRKAGWEGAIENE